MASELDALATKMLASKEFFPAKQRTALFKYLWENRDRVSPAIDIWEGALHPVSGSKDKDEAQYDYDRTVRQSCRDLKTALQRYFAEATHAGGISTCPPLNAALDTGWKSSGWMIPTALRWDSGKSIFTRPDQ